MESGDLLYPSHEHLVISGKPTVNIGDHHSSFSFNDFLPIKANFQFYITYLLSAPNMDRSKYFDVLNIERSGHIILLLSDCLSSQT